MPAFGEEGETSEASLFRLGKLFSAQLLSAIVGSRGGGVQGSGTELLHITPTEWGLKPFIILASLSTQATVSPHSNTQLSATKLMKVPGLWRQSWGLQKLPWIVGRSMRMPADLKRALSPTPYFTSSTKVTLLFHLLGEPWTDCPNSPGQRCWEAHWGPPTKPTHWAWGNSKGASGAGSGTSARHSQLRHTACPGSAAEVGLCYLTTKFQSRGDHDIIWQWFEPPKYQNYTFCAKYRVDLYLVKDIS